MRKQILKNIPVILCFILLGLWLARPINLAAVDIGRHIKNGEMVLAGQKDVLYTNFYSFTFPEYPFINHHWFFGVLSFGIWKVSGFIGLSLVYIAIMMGALFFFWRSARLRGNLPLALCLTALALPVLAERREIRPEGLSLLFMGLYFYLLTRLSLGKIRRSIVFIILGIAQVIWVNTHIFFFMGPVLVAVFLWEGLSRNCKVCAQALLPLLGLTLAVNVINPSGIAGMLTPLNIFKEFGYRLAENQNIFFMMGFFPQDKNYPYYLFLVGLMVLSMIVAIWARGFKLNAPFIALGVFAACAGLKAVRLMTPFGFLFIPLAAFFLGQVAGRWSHAIEKTIQKALLTVAVFLGLFFAWQLRGEPMGVGLYPGVDRSAEFFKAMDLKGPIFSNYDIGGYLIFHLSLRERVFVDNRQEAFPPKFFKDVYVPMQEDNTVWTKVDGQYQFNVIYFYRHDLTPWGQNFLIQRVQDPLWAPVFVDDYTIIFLKRNALNQSLIGRYELPKSMFGIKG